MSRYGQQVERTVRDGQIVMSAVFEEAVQQVVLHVEGRHVAVPAAAVNTAYLAELKRKRRRTQTVPGPGVHQHVLCSVSVADLLEADLLEADLLEADLLEADLLEADL